MCRVLNFFASGPRNVGYFPEINELAGTEMFGATLHIKGKYLEISLILKTFPDILGIATITL